MSNKNKGFETFVTIFVMLVGTGFGAYTGLVYYASYWWAGAAAGALSSYPLAKLYLKQLIKISARRQNKKVVWLSGTLMAILCGVICTTLVHGVMILVIACNPNVSLGDVIDGLWAIVLIVGEIIGACAGLIVGGLCSSIYIARIMKESNEAA
jgi:hypothetical protein